MCRCLKYCLHWNRTLFVDIHNHILPGIDDGAQDLAEALSMARQAVGNGTDTMIATPHRAWMGRRDAPPDWIREQVIQLQTALDQEGIPLSIRPGVEIPISPKVAEELQSGTLLTLADAGKWVLVEPPFERLPPDGLSSLQAIREARFEVVLAHPERNTLIQHRLTFVEACADLGIALQITTGSLLGHFGPKAQRTAEAILAHAAEWQIVIASDTHDLLKRSSNLMAAARDAAAKHVGPELAQVMVDTRPRAMLGQVKEHG